MSKTKAFGCIVADPAWKFGDKLPGNGRGAAKHYGCMTVSEIMRYPLPPLMDSCWLFLWRVAAMQQEALDVAHAWGFTVKSEIVWVKTKNKPTCNTVRIGMGRTVRNAHEVCLVCTRGKPAVHDHAVSSVIFAPRLDHSRKPEELQTKAEKLAGPVPKIELFARRHRDGWTCRGDELQAAAAAE